MSREVFTHAQNHTEKLHEFLLAGSRLTPEKPAVMEFVDNETGFLSYRQLEHRAESYAAVLAELGLDIGDRVLLETDTSPSAVAALLACSSLGLPFVPVSPETPTRRLLSIVESVRPALYLKAVDSRREGVPDDMGTGRFGPEGLVVERAPTPRTPVRQEVTAADPAYMVFTSGTTGRPKGVVMSHRAILSFYRGMLGHGIAGPESRVASTAPFQFDFSLLDIGLALGSGATLVPVPRALLRWPRRFVRFLRETEATQVNGAPSIWRGALRSEAEELGTLGDRIHGVLFSGEPFPLPEVRRLQELLPHARIVNCFGSTESVAASFTDVPRPVPDGLTQLPIGFAHRGAEMMLLDEENRAITEPGVVGHIHLRSSSLFTGYWGDPEATARALVPDPLSPLTGQTVFRTGDLGHRGEGGELYFDGRADSQVKIRGNRVELTEVERRVAEFAGVAAASAVLLPVEGADPMLAVFVTLADGAELDKVELGAFCMEELPDYMAPQQIHVLGEIPVNANGKVDRPALVERMSARLRP
ncbi:D-alanine--poly(phosphoribitol) ligase [Streptomyces lancefieldiae]|uniref:D-alanine--poly(Phosphoribitol) ligase n=1 Tax=Streptomyces lancefieldiae TaxID=3075520 RepID=A0ABU3B060_9ACTN|nr:D-alanine--poly(phosphoribitol) ligase [Streptomyces sp. DSM 40712]MDT0615644.1 D-alanine--poly(phosphoribitol) ligase [Streptomyces sp. DSM 40712]